MQEYIKTPNTVERQVIKLEALLKKAEILLELMNRTEAILVLGPIYDTLIDLNKTKGEALPLQSWNPKGLLTKEQFDDLNLNRKILSNKVGIMTSSGVVRHDLNKL